MDLGCFSVSLTVKDLARSQTFYESLGFSALGGDPEGGWLIMRSGSTTIGLFQGMFEKNMLTFNPGWDGNGNAQEDFEDVRAVQRRLAAAGIEPVEKVDEATTGPASFIVVDPDGNPILFDQHV